MEEWKDVVGFEGKYRVSNLGNIFSIPKEIVIGKNGGRVLRGGFNLKQYQLPNGGHLRVYLADGSGKKKPLLVHRLVAIAFIENPDNQPVINHIDNNPSNNCVSNLEWCSIAHNNACSLATGTRRQGNQKGTANSNAKLNDTIVRAIRERFKNIGNASAVAKEFGINPRHALHIINGTMWSHIN